MSLPATITQIVWFSRLFQFVGPLRLKSVLKSPTYFLGLRSESDPTEVPCVRKVHSLDSILRQLNSAHVFTPYCLEIRLYIIYLFTHRFLKWSLSASPAILCGLSVMSSKCSAHHNFYLISKLIYKQHAYKLWSCCLWRAGFLCFMLLSIPNTLFWNRH